MVLINSEWVNYLTPRSLLTDKKYGVHFSSTTSGILKVIDECVCQVLDENCKDGAVVLVIVKSIDSDRHACLTNNFTVMKILAVILN